MKKHHYLLAAMLLTFFSVMSAQTQTRTYTVNGVSFKMIAVEGGTFIMGATSEQNDPRDDEKPAHKVTLSSFSIGQTEVTQALWKAVMGDYRVKWFRFKGNNLPVETVGWIDTQKFISKLNEMTEGQRPKGRKFRLPTEAEWEFAARGGNRSRHTQFAGSNNISSVAWCDYLERHRGSTQPVAKKSPNELGLYDMSGNVWEWCQDVYDSNYYNRSSSKNPCNRKSEGNHVRRGGSWANYTHQCRTANRDSSGLANDETGIRLAM